MRRSRCDSRKNRIPGVLYRVGHVVRIAALSHYRPDPALRVRITASGKVGSWRGFAE